jgi:hypothetical protein
VQALLPLALFGRTTSLTELMDAPQFPPVGQETLV